MDRCSKNLFYTFTSFYKTCVITLVFRRVGYSGSSLGWEQHPLCFIAQQVGKQNILNNFEINISIFQRGHHTRQLQEESAKVQEQGRRQGLLQTQNLGSSFKLHSGSSYADQSRSKWSQPRWSITCSVGKRKLQHKEKDILWPTMVLIKSIL